MNMTNMRAKVAALLLLAIAAPLRAQDLPRKELLRRVEVAKAHITPQYGQGDNSWWAWEEPLTKCDTGKIKSRDAAHGCTDSVIYDGRGVYLAVWYDGVSFEFQGPAPAVAVERDGDAALAARLFGQPVDGSQRDNGDDGLLKPAAGDETSITGYAPLDRPLHFLFDHIVLLIFVFGVLTLLSLFHGKLEGGNFNDQIREEAAERWEEEYGDDSIHNPFDEPEGMQPASQYVPVRRNHPEE